MDGYIFVQLFSSSWLSTPPKSIKRGSSLAPLYLSSFSRSVEIVDEAGSWRRRNTRLML